MATITESGVVGRSLGDYRELLNERFLAVFGETLSLDPETPQGEIIGIMALSLAEQDEGTVAQSNALSPTNAIGQQLVDQGAIIGLKPNSATPSTVSATLSGTPGAHVPALSRASTDASDEFETLVQVTIGSGGAIAADMRSVETGPVPAAVNALTRIVTRVPGWESVTNAAAATPGVDAESNAAFRARVLLSPHRLRRGPVRALESALLEAGATRVRVEENDTNAQVTRQGLNIQAHGVRCIVKGGTDADIAAAVATKTLGASTSGGVLVGSIRFHRVTETAVKVAITTTLATSGFPADGLAAMKESLVAYAVAAWQIGEGVVPARLYSPVNAIGGHSVTALTVTDTSDNVLPTVTPLATLYTLDVADVDITTN